MLFSVAWKNIWRNKLRSLIVIFAIVIGLFGGLYGSAIMLGMVDQRIRLAIANEVSNIQIHQKDFILNKELKDTIPDMARLKGVLNSMHTIKAYTCRLKVVGMASSATNGLGVMINGIDPDREKLVTDICKSIPDSLGSWFGDRRKNQVVIGHKLMEKLKVKPRSKIVLIFQDDSGNMVSGAFKITGVYRTSNTSFDEANIFVSRSDLQTLLGFRSERSHEISIALNDDGTNAADVSTLGKISSDLTVVGWKEIMPDLGMMNDMMMMWLYLVMVIILLALSFGIINTMMMSVLERTRELGMLMAVGMNRRRVFIMIMLESVMLSLCGGLLGMGISALVIQLSSRYGVDLSTFGKGMEDMGFSAIAYPMLGTGFYIGLTALVILTGILSSLMPARRALKLKPVEAIRIL